MSINVKDVQSKINHHLFVGRDKELELLHRIIGDSSWYLLNFHGPGGIGKSTLLRHFAEGLNPARCFYFNGYSGMRNPADFLNKIRLMFGGQLEGEDPVDLINQSAYKNQGAVLLLDTFEQWSSIEDWLRDDFIPKLKPQVKVITAGHYALTDRWQRADCSFQVRNVGLQPLSSQEIRRFAYIQGIQNRKILNSLISFTGGVPLALSMACEVIVRNGNTSFLEPVEKKQVIGRLAAELTQDYGNDLLERCTEAASVVWKFDQELLQTMLGERIPNEQFREFCRLPFVIRQDDRWLMHDAIRQWIFTDFRSRKPQAFHDYRQRALQVIRERTMVQSVPIAEVIFEKIYLHENDFIRCFCFQWEDRLILRECDERDIFQVEQLYLKHLTNQGGYRLGDIHLEGLIRPLWQMDPTAFLGLWMDDQLVAFTACHLLTDETVQIFEENPITAPAVAKYDPNGRQHLICLAGVEPDLENEVSGSLARALARLINRSSSIINILPLQEWGDYLSLLGYERLVSADSSSHLGTPYQAYLLDLRSEDLPAKIDRMLSYRENVISDLQITMPIESDAVLSLEDTVELVQKTLKSYSRLPLYPQLASSLSSLFKDQCLGLDAESIARRVQNRLQSILHKLQAGTREEQQLYKILYYAYVQKIGTHEIVSEFLNIPTPTYFRYLRKAVRKVAYEWTKLNE